ncbi:MAG: Flp pilus assembly pilin Flp [Alphaproteobacteria bacterium]|jgi:Flp pilus assembly pilin Flp
MHALLYLRQIIFCLRREKRGAIAAEYAFLLVFIAIVATAGMLVLGDGLVTYFSAMGLTIGDSAKQS